MKNLIDKKFTYVVIGASNDKEKYGYKVLKDLLSADFNVIPVNLREKEILNKKVYKSVLDIDKKIDVAIFVVPPEVTLKILADIKKIGIDKVWMQPGSESEEAEKYCGENDIEYISKACIMINRR